MLQSTEFYKGQVLNMEEWNRDFYGISIRYEDKIVRIKSDEALTDFLESPNKGSFVLAEYILIQYEEIYHKPLKINLHSLAIEIIAHVFVDTILENMSELSDSISHDIFKPVTAALESIRKHTQVIDCGEASVDNNRHVWDALEPFHGIIYGIAGLTGKDRETN